MTAQSKRTESLQNKLTSLGARHRAMTTGPDKGPLDWYELNSQVVIVHLYAKGGYEVYAPVAGASLSVQETLDALDRIAVSNPAPLSVDRPVEEMLQPQPAGSLPPDPEGQNNNRAWWAQAAIAAFRHATRTDPEDALPDLLCDLMHWADRYGQSFDVMLDRARQSYEEETMPEPAPGEVDRLKAIAAKPPNVEGAARGAMAEMLQDQDNIEGVPV